MEPNEQLAYTEQTRESDERIRIMFDATPLGAHFWDENLNVVDCNLAAVKLFNLSDKREYMERYFELTPEFQPDGTRSFDKLRNLIDKTYKEGYHRVEWMRQTLDGEPIPVELTMVRLNYKNLIAGYCRDLREDKRMQRELEATTRENELQLLKLNLMVKATKIGLWDIEIVRNDPINPVNVFTWSNEFRHMLGYTDENDFPNVLGSWSNLIHPDDKKTVLDAFEKHMMDTTGNTPYDIEYRMFKKNGECAYYRDSGETVRDKNGNPIRAAGSLLDVNEVKNLISEAQKQRAKADAANKAKSAFLSTVSHEIRTPMNAILGITEIQLQNNALDPSVREVFEKIYTSGDMLLGIVNDILDLSKIEAGKLGLLPHKYEIASLISDTAQINMRWIASKPVEFELYVDENLPAVLFGDELRVKQILNNLLSNAFKYTARGSVTMSISAHAADSGDDEITLFICVSDTGQGMTKEQVDSLFDEYSRFNQEANRTTEGTGLGMSITYKLLRLMNGDIAVESEPGKGSTLTVRLPQGKADPGIIGKEMAENLQRFRTSSISQMKRVQITRDPMPYGSVLVVDDVETNIFVARGLLSPYELKVDSVDSGYGAVEKIKNGAVYDIIFMDYMMPKMDGVEATKILRKTGYKRPIVALTANAASWQTDIFLGNGFDGVISKPIDIRQLNAVLNKLVRDKHPPEVVEAARQRAEAKNEHRPNNAAPPALNQQIAEIFVRDANKSIAELDRLIEKGGPYSIKEMQTYVIHIHGMNGTLANIGKTDLSAIAHNLEELGRNNDTGAITAKTPFFLDSLRALVNELTLMKDPDSWETADEDKPYLTKKLLAIKAACEEYDGNTVDKMLAELTETEWPCRIMELLDRIAEKLLHSDFDEIADDITKFMKTL